MSPSLRSAPRASLRIHTCAKLWLGASLLSIAFTASAAGASTPLSAGLSPEGARQVLARGAVAWDLREAGPLIPGAVRIHPQALQAWFERGDVDALGAAVSAAGLNLAAEVLVYADDDATVQAVVTRLKAVSRGRVHWLAGGGAAWQAAGLPTVALPANRLPLPQKLVALDDTASAQPADARRRGTQTSLFAAGSPAARGSFSMQAAR